MNDRELDRHVTEKRLERQRGAALSGTLGSLWNRSDGLSQELVLNHTALVYLRGFGPGQRIELDVATEDAGFGGSGVPPSIIWILLRRDPGAHTVTATPALGDEFPKSRQSYRPGLAGFRELPRLDGKDSILRQEL